MAKIDLPHRPEIDTAMLLASLEPVFAGEYEVKQIPHGVRVRAKWYWVFVRVKHWPDKDRTRVEVIPNPTPRALAIILPLLLVAVIPGGVAFFVIRNRAKPLEERVTAQLEQATAAGSSRPANAAGA